MIFVAGSNLFGQWFSDNCVFSHFQVVEIVKNEDLKFDPKHGKLINASWSYNIFQIENRFYISGSWRGRENQFIKVDLPKDSDRVNLSNLTMVGNDYNLLLVDMLTQTIWVIDLETDNKIKKINFIAETPLVDNVPESAIKKMRREDSIVKVVPNNNSCVYLTAKGLVYVGILPSHLDTSHCEGKICDIQCGYEHFLLLTDLGRVYTWGNGRRLQLGHGDVSNLELPTEVEALAGIKIVNIKAGGWHSLALSEFGDLYTWGWNDMGQLGINSDTKNSEKEDLKSCPLPTLVDIFENEKEVTLNIKDIACGTRHSAILLEDNTVWTTGCNKYGQLGLSPDAHTKVTYFKKSYQCEHNVGLMCGPWSTILMTK